MSRGAQPNEASVQQPIDYLVAEIRKPRRRRVVDGAADRSRNSALIEGLQLVLPIRNRLRERLLGGKGLWTN